MFIKWYNTIQYKPFKQEILQMNPSVFILEDNKLFAQNLVDMIGQYPLKLNCIVTSDLATAMAQLNDSIHYTEFFIDIFDKK